MADNTRSTDRAVVGPEQACPIAPVVDIVFSRWTTPILWTLNVYGRHRFTELEGRIAKITPKPVTTVFLTHSDGDHVNGLVAYPAGIKIIAHQNNKKELETALAAGGRGAPPPDRLPTQVVTKNKETMTIAGTQVTSSRNVARIASLPTTYSMRVSGFDK